MGSCLQLPALASFSDGLDHDTISPVNPFLSNLLCSWCFFAAMGACDYLSHALAPVRLIFEPEFPSERTWGHELVSHGHLCNMKYGLFFVTSCCILSLVQQNPERAVKHTGLVLKPWLLLHQCYWHGPLFQKKSDRLTSINMELQTRCNGCWVINPGPIQKTSGDRFPLRQVIFNYSDMESLDLVRYRDMWWPPVRNVVVKLQLLIHCTQRKESIWTWRVKSTENSWYFYLSILVIMLMKLVEKLERWPRA